MTGTPPLPDLQKLKSACASAPGWVVLSYEAKLVTPAMGGGVIKGASDGRHPFRGRGLKGQIRRWWRRLAAHAALNDQLQAWAGQQLYEQECLRFGGNGPEREPLPSSVHVRVKAGPWSAVNAQDYRGAAYALFPTRSTGQLLIREGCSVSIAIEVHEDYVHEIDQAMRWWSSLGGFGARGTRGVGSVVVRDGKGRLLEPVTLQECQKLRIQLVKGPGNHESPTGAWFAAIEKMRQFRQGHDAHSVSKWLPQYSVGGPPPPTSVDESVRARGTVFKKERDYKTIWAYRPGRSTWWDANSVRDAVGICDNLNRPTGFRILFAKAAFGLPIVGEAINGPHGGKPMGGFELRPNRDGGVGSRMKSSLIIKAMPGLTPQGSLYFQPVAALLEDEAADALAATVRLDFKPKDNWQPSCRTRDDQPIWPADVEERERIARQMRPLAVLGDGAQDPLSAFLNFFRRP